MQRLFTPGPVRVPRDILDACAEQPLHHRSDEFIACSKRVWTNLQHVFRTAHPVVLLAGSGMTGIEAAVASTAGRPVVLVHGRFGDRIAHIHRIYGADPIVFEVPWGQTITPDDVATLLRNTSDATSLWMVHSETSSGVAIDVQAIASVARSVHPDILIAVDAVGSLCIHPLETDAWELDLVMSGIQKGLMCPPGLACVSISPRAEARIASPNTYTLDLGKVLADQRKGLFTWTPPVTLLRGLDVALEMLKSETLEHIWQRHADVTATLQEGLRDRGLQVFGEATSHAVTVVLHEHANALRQLLLQRHAIVIADGQEAMAGKAVRIGTCGTLTIRDVLELFHAIDDVLPYVSNTSVDASRSTV